MSGRATGVKTRRTINGQRPGFKNFKKDCRIRQERCQPPPRRMMETTKDGEKNLTLKSRVNGRSVLSTVDIGAEVTIVRPNKCTAKSSSYSNVVLSNCQRSKRTSSRRHGDLS